VKTTNPALERHQMKTFLCCAVPCAALLMANAPCAPAQQYPTKPIRLLVGFAAGGPSDVAARTIAQKLTEKWGQQVIVDIRPGAGGRPRAVSRVPACGM
jgi:tripartite-type tricarboxylate transporter receptor subunit TctC